MPKKRPFRRYLRGKVNQEISIGTIGSKAANATVMPDSVSEKAWISSMRASWALSNYTPVADAGPILVGVAHSDYSTAEIEEFLETLGSWDEGDLIEQERARRRIRVVGVFEEPEDTTDVVVLGDGGAITTKLGWMLQSGMSLKTFTYNLGGVSLSGATTPNLAIRGHVNLWPA